MKSHPFAGMFPMMDEATFAEVREDVRLNGIREPIMLLDGEILDGRNRYDILVDLAETGELLGPGWGHRAGEPLDPEALLPDNQWFARFNPMVDGDALDWVRSKNLRRRHLNDKQRAMAAATYATFRVGRPARVEADAAPPIGGISAAALAKTFGTRARSVERARAVVRDGAPELIEAVRDDRIALSTAEAIARLPADAQADVVARGEKEILAAAKEIRHRRRVVRFNEVSERISRIAAGNADLPTGRRYNIVYVDPPTEYESGFDDRSIENHYPTMPTAEILALPVGALAADDALCVLWTTVPQLRNSIAFLEAWGFAFVSLWGWDKIVQGTGHWAFNDLELVLIGKRGHFPAPIPGTQPRTLHHERKGEHSAKPLYFTELIERLWPAFAGSRIELFTRRAARPGWAVWGNQALQETPSTDGVCKPSSEGQTGPSTASGTGTAASLAAVDPAAVKGAGVDAHPHAPPAVPSPHPLDIPEFLRRRNDAPCATPADSSAAAATCSAAADATTATTAAAGTTTSSTTTASPAATMTTMPSSPAEAADAASSATAPIPETCEPAEDTAAAAAADPCSDTTVSAAADPFRSDAA